MSRLFVIAVLAALVAPLARADESTPSDSPPSTSAPPSTAAPATSTAPAVPAGAPEPTTPPPSLQPKLVPPEHRTGNPKHDIIPPGHSVPDEPFTHDESPYSLRLDLDIATLALGATLWAGTSFIGNTAPPPYCGGSNTPACNPAALNAFDRLAVGHLNQNARTAADVIEFVPIVYLGLDMFDVGLKNWKTYLTDLWVVAEALAWNGAIQDIVRRAVRRPRPFLYTPGAYPSERDGAEASFSFYSGHTSFAFALAVSCSYTFTLRHPHSKWKWVIWPALLAVASIEPVLRVYSGDHFPTDVIVGAVAGSAIGLLFPALHRRLRSGPKVVTGMRLVPVVSQGQTVVALVGLF